jgi:hypothetical protein
MRRKPLSAMTSAAAESGIRSQDKDTVDNIER